MSTLLEQASLVMIPSGYKEDVVYSQIPTSGAGDLSFTRASNGTRVNSAGLVEVCPWNLASYSEDFGNAVWSKTNATITANDTTAPNGTTTADKFAPNGTLTTSYFSISETVVSGATSQAHTAIIYAKAGGLTQMLMYLGNQIGIYFNLSNGQFISYYNGVQTIINYSSEAVGDGWYKYTISISANSGSTYLEVYGAKSGAFIGNYTTADDCFIWGAQLNIGSTAKPYFPTTDRLNVPRLTYQNGGGGCPSLLLEKQSTNLFSYSEDFSNAAWFKDSGIVITPNAAISPDGTQNASLMDYQNNSISMYRYPGTGGVQYTMSVYVKAYSGYSGKRIGLVNGPSSLPVTLTNEWQRVDLTATISTPNIEIYNRVDFEPIKFYLWGAQYEASSYATSYIPTTSSSATRVADMCYKTGISSLIGQTEGTLYWDGVAVQGNYNQLMFIKDSSVNQFIGMTVGTGVIYGEIYNSGYVHLYSYSIGANDTRFKMALAYKTNSFAFYVNGVQVASSTTGTTPTSFDDFYLGNTNNLRDLNCQVNEAVIFPTRLTNAELQAITTI